jgi:type 1 glutamine amidotransferase
MRHIVVFLAAAWLCFAADRKIPAVIIDGVNNHDWVAATNAIREILDGTGRFTVDVCTYPKRPDLSRYDVVINNFSGGHTEKGQRWPADFERALESYVRSGGGLVIFHAANNAFLDWSEYNRMIGLGWRPPSFGEGLAIESDQVRRIPKGEGAQPGHGPRHDFDVFVLDRQHPITRELPAHWNHPSEQLTHGQHGPAEGLTVLTYAFSEVTHQGEPMDWVRAYGKGRVYTTMLGHTWQNEANPNLDDVYFQALLARGTEWAATGDATLPPDLGWKPLFNGKDLQGWQVRGTGEWNVMPGGVLVGHRTASPFGAWPAGQTNYRQWFNLHSWLYTNAEFGEFDLHVEYWIPAGSNSGVSIRDRSRAHHAVGESDADRPEFASYPKTTPSHVGYEIQIVPDDREEYKTGSVYSLAAAPPGLHRPGEWNSLDIESRRDRIRVRVNGRAASEYAGDQARSLTGPIGLQLHDQFTLVMFRNIRIREIASH